MLNWFFSTEVKRYTSRAVRSGPAWAPAPSRHSDTLVRGIPGARQVMFEESGHRVIKEENERFVRVVTEFIHESR